MAIVERFDFKVLDSFCLSTSQSYDAEYVKDSASTASTIVLEVAANIANFVRTTKTLMFVLSQKSYEQKPIRENKNKSFMHIVS